MSSFTLFICDTGNNSKAIIHQKGNYYNVGSPRQRSRQPYFREVPKQTTQAGALTTAPKVMSAVTFTPELALIECADNILKILYL